MTIPMPLVIDAARLVSKTWSSPGRPGLPYEETPPGSAGARAFNGFYIPAVSPKFKLSRSPSLFAVGSCFAREIERSLHTRGIKPLSWSPDSPIPNERFHRYNPFSMLNDFEIAFGMRARPEWSSVKTRSGWTDYTGYGAYPTKKECDAARSQVIEAHQQAASAEVVVATFGMIEAWYDRLTETWLNTAPLGAESDIRGRFELRVLSHSDCLSAMMRLREVVRRVNPSVRIVATTSPVPLNCTFHGVDAGVSNAMSKSTLRSAVGEFAFRCDDVDYFPSYEIVTLSDPGMSWLPDKRHVSPVAVETITKFFIDNYMEK